MHKISFLLSSKTASKASLGVFIVVVVLSGSCSTSGVLEVRSNSEASNGAVVRLIELQDGKSSGEQIGALPQSLTLEQVQGKQISIEKSGYESQNYVFLPELGDANALTVELKPKEAGQSQVGLPEKKLVDASLLLLKAYQALSNNQYQAAIDISKQSQQVKETGPGPTIIESIALWRLGKNSDALERLQASKTIYPQVGELETLIQAIESN